MFPKIVYRFINSKGLSKNTSNMKSNVISTQFTNSTHFYKTLITTQFIPQIRNYEHPRYESSTTIPHNNKNINQT